MINFNWKALAFLRVDLAFFAYDYLATLKSCKCCVFHVMLKNNIAPNIVQKLSSNQWRIILGAGLLFFEHYNCMLLSD